MRDLPVLAELIRQRNALEEEIAAITNRPALMGHLGEFIAARIFEIQLAQGANTKAIDGHFSQGSLAGRSVNVKWYGKKEHILDLCTNGSPDFYLVFTGPLLVVNQSRTRPWLIEHAYLFDSCELDSLITCKKGIATSVRKHIWESFELYPNPRCPHLVLSADQRAALALFGRAPAGEE